MTCRLLIVEDDLRYRSAVRTIAEESECTIQEAADRSTAQNLLLRGRFDMAIVDICLDRKDPRNRDGLELLEVIAKLGDGTFAVLLSSVATQERDRIAHEVGARQVLRKQDSGFREALADLVKEAARAAAADKLVSAKAHGISVLSGENPPGWLEGLGIFGSIDRRALENFCAEVVVGLLPLLPKRGENPALDDVRGVVVGEYWSRGIGSAVEVTLGQVDAVGPREAHRSERFGGNLSIPQRLERYVRWSEVESGPELAAAVYVAGGVKPSLYELGEITRLLR